MAIPATALTLSVGQLIIQAQAAYARCIDDDEGRGWPDFFADKCLYVVTTAENHRLGMQSGIIFADSKGMLIDRISALKNANIYEQHRYRHILSQPLISRIDSEWVWCETGFMVARIMRTGETSLFATGRYLDCYRITQSHSPLLEERRVICDSNRIDTLLALPL